MFGEVTGKSKDQLKAELWKMRLKRMKRHIPAIVGGLTTIAAAVLAEHYRRQVVILELVDPDAWPLLPVPPASWERVESGDTLQYRQARISDDDVYAQYTTNKDGFSTEMDEKFDEYKKSIPVTPED